MCLRKKKEEQILNKENNINIRMIKCHKIKISTSNYFYIITLIKVFFSNKE